MLRRLHPADRALGNRMVVGFTCGQQDGNQAPLICECVDLGVAPSARGGGLIFDLSGSYDRASQIGAPIGFATGIAQILAGGPTRRQDRIAAPAAAAT